MKKILYILVTVLEIVCFAGAYIVNYFTRKKMGMARYVVYKNQGWRTRYPLELIMYGVIAMIAVFAVFTLIVYIRNRKKAGKLIPTMNFVMLILDIWYIWFTLSNSTDTLRSYYFMSLLFALTAGLQTIKTCAATIMGNKKKIK